MHRFSLYSEGQPLGALSVQATASGTVAPERILVAVKIPEAHFYMAEGNRKQLQPLKRPADVVIFEQGRPRDRREARRLEELAKRSLPPPAPDQLAMHRPGPAEPGATNASAGRRGTSPRSRRRSCEVRQAAARR